MLMSVVIVVISFSISRLSTSWESTLNKSFEYQYSSFCLIQMYFKFSQLLKLLELR